MKETTNSPPNRHKETTLQEKSFLQSKKQKTNSKFMRRLALASQGIWLLASQLWIVVFL